MSGHSVRAHSKFSASGSERWLNCAASVKLEEGLPGTSSPWAEEGTEAHEVLEVLFGINRLAAFNSYRQVFADARHPMLSNAKKMVDYVRGVRQDLVDAELLVEVRVHNGEIHPEMFGTVDAALVELYGTLHVFDYKYGQGHVVKAEKNTQMIQYALGLAERFDWNFSDVEVHIVQPRASGKGIDSWRLSIEELRQWREIWRKGVARVERGDSKPFAGSWCHWCKAKTTCPAKTGKITELFLSQPIGGQNGEESKKDSKKINEESGFKSEAEWRKAQKRKKGSDKIGTKKSKTRGTPFDDAGSDVDFY